MSPPPAAAPLRPRRSRNGCIGCRKAKVKCDEIKPHCGTCRRRNLACPGYGRLLASAPTSISPHAASPASPVGASGDNVVGLPAVREGSTSLDFFSPQSRPEYHDLIESPTPSMHSSTIWTQTSTPSSSELHIEAFGSSMTLLPSGVVSPADERNIALYFNRHPGELVMGDDFVREMNANTVLLLQQDPPVVSNAIAAIGSAYQLKDSAGSGTLVLARRSKILADLRLMKQTSSYFEMALHLLLALCAMELVTFAEPRQTTSIPTLLGHVPALISHHLSLGGNGSFVSRYLLRGLARQDFVVSLVNLRRFRISTYAWLELQDATKPDRLLGYTNTLMPLLEELCALAEDLRDHILIRGSSRSSLGGATKPATNQEGCIARARSLRERLTSWQPPTISTGCFRVARKFHAQASCYRTGALLYLHRLLHPPPHSPSPTALAPTSSFALDIQSDPLIESPSASTSTPNELSNVSSESFVPEAEGRTGAESNTENEALHKAHDILFCAGGLPGADTKLLLWPVFLAACELKDPEDRASVLSIFRSILECRRTATALRTKAFVKDIVWRARDSAEEWNWMILAQQYPGECLPI